MTKDPFSIKLSLRHPSYKPESISKALSLKAELSHAVGERLGKLRTRRKTTFFYTCLQKGAYISELEGALTNVALFLEKNTAFLSDFTGGNGEVELILNHTIYPQEEEGDKCFELYLSPAFLGLLSTRGIGLRVQGWQGTSKHGPVSRSKRTASR